MGCRFSLIAEDVSSGQPIDIRRRCVSLLRLSNCVFCNTFLIDSIIILAITGAHYICSVLISALCQVKVWSPLT